MKIIYMGTPDFAVPAMEALDDAGHEISLVVTQPDAVRDRGRKIKFPPVKEAAINRGIEVLQPERIRDNEEFALRLREISPDLIAVAAYGRILPKEVLSIPRLGCVNVHASLLPRFRGAAPIQRAIQAGDDVTGVTIMYMAEGLDTGNMIAKATTAIDKKTGGELHDELAHMGAKLLVETIPEIGINQGEEQSDADATYAPMISKKEGHIDFSKAPVEIARDIRAFDPWPGTYAYYGDKTLKLWKGEAVDKAVNEKPGMIVSVSPDGIDVAAGGRVLRVTEIQMPGRKRVAVKEYLKGNSIETGTVLG